MGGSCTIPLTFGGASTASPHASSAATTTASCSRAATSFSPSRISTTWRAWRADSRRQARADKVNVRTGYNDGIVWALRVRRHGQEWQTESDRCGDLVSLTVPLATELQHEVMLALRDGDEVVCSCDRCAALGYGSAADDVFGGALFEDECPDEDAPKLTPLGDDARRAVPPAGVVTRSPTEVKILRAAVSAELTWTSTAPATRERSASPQLVGEIRCRRSTSMFSPRAVVAIGLKQRTRRNARRRRAVGARFDR